MLGQIIAASTAIPVFTNDVFPRQAISRLRLADGPLYWPHGRFVTFGTAIDMQLDSTVSTLNSRPLSAGSRDDVLNHASDQTLLCFQLQDSQVVVSIPVEVEPASLFAFWQLLKMSKHRSKYSTRLRTRLKVE